MKRGIVTLMREPHLTGAKTIVKIETRIFVKESIKDERVAES